MIPYSITSTSLSLVLGFKPKVIPASHPNFAEIARLLLLPDTTEEDLTPLVDVAQQVAEFKSKNIAVIDNRLYYKGFPLTSKIANVILGFVNRGQLDAAEPYKNFLERAQMNPDPRAVVDLYDWVAASGLPITPDGFILAWKAVGLDYMSIKSGPRGKLDHSIGNTVSEPRHETDPNPAVTCSRGIHFCSAPYLRFYTGGGTRVIAVKIDPMNVVAFPKDYNNEKGRCCELEVVGEVKDRAKVSEFYPQGRAVFDGFERPDFEIGQVWRTREGMLETISRRERPDSPHLDSYPVRTSTGGSYTAKGRYVSDDEKNQRDLVQRVS